MSVVRQDKLEDHKVFLSQIGYLAIINGKGPFSGLFAQSAIGQYTVREDIKDVTVGDEAYNGAEWGTVTAKGGDAAGGFSFTVKYSHTILPQGQDPATWNPARTVVYTSMLPAAANVTGFPTTNQWQKLASIGVVVVKPTNGSIPTSQTIALESAAPTIQQGGPATSLDFNVAAVSVQKTVDGVASGSPVIANASGVASVPNGNTTGQVIRFVVSKTGHNTVTFGPYTVIAP